MHGPQTVDIAPSADASVQIIAGPTGPAAAGGGNGNASPDKLLALLTAAGLANGGGSPGSPLTTGGRPQLWQPSSAAEGSHQPPRKSARHVQRRLIGA